MSQHDFAERNGWVKMWRFGPVKFQKQGQVRNRAPRKTGLWAFPYPIFDLYYAYHKYAEHMPKGLYDSGTPEDVESWIKNKGKNVLRMSEFWYKGDVYTHLNQKGDLGEAEGTDPEWNLMDSGLFLKNVRKHRYWMEKRSPENGGGFYYQKEDAIIAEVFISHGMGSFRSTPGR